MNTISASSLSLRFSDLFSIMNFRAQNVSHARAIFLLILFSMWIWNATICPKYTYSDTCCSSVELILMGVCWLFVFICVFILTVAVVTGILIFLQIPRLSCKYHHVVCKSQISKSVSIHSYTESLPQFIFRNMSSSRLMKSLGEVGSPCITPFPSLKDTPFFSVATLTSNSL